MGLRVGCPPPIHGLIQITLKSHDMLYQLSPDLTGLSNLSHLNDVKKLILPPLVTFGYNNWFSEQVVTFTCQKV